MREYSAFLCLVAPFLLSLAGCEYEHYYSFLGTHMVTVDCSKIVPTDAVEGHKSTGPLRYEIIPDFVPATSYRYRLFLDDHCAVQWIREKDDGYIQTKFFATSACVYQWNLCGLPMKERFIDFYGPAEVVISAGKEGQVADIRIPCRVTDSAAVNDHAPGVEAVYQFSGNLTDYRTVEKKF